MFSLRNKGIADYDYFLDAPELYMYGMLSVLLATGIWLITASYWELPVSTTHSVVGGIVGMTVCARGWMAVAWYAPSNSFPFIDGVASIALSWIFSPVLSGIFAILLFLPVRTFVLRSDNAYSRSWWIFPVLVFLTVVVNSYFIIVKGVSNKLSLSLETAVWVSFLIGGIAAAIVGAFIAPFLRRKTDREFDLAERKTAAADAGAADEEQQEVEVKPAEGVNVDPKTGESIGRSTWNTISRAISTGINHNIHDALVEDHIVGTMHELSEKFDPKTEESFKYLQVFTAICDSFAHGANDVANSVGPFAAIWGIYVNTGIKLKSPVPVWILCLGGLGIVLGLATYGYKIMCAIGVKMCRITPSRGFAIELGAAVVIVVGSQLGLPLSTTHCQVGSTVGIGLLEGTKEGVNWRLLGKMVVGWIMTLLVVALTAAAFFALGVYAPSTININERNLLQRGMEANALFMVETLNQTVYTEMYPDLTDILDILAATVRHMTADPAENLYAQAVPVQDSVDVLTNATVTTLGILVPASGGDLPIVNGSYGIIFGM